MLIDQTTPAPPATRPDCDYCDEPSTGIRVRLDRDDPTAKRVAIGHEGCYPRFLDDVVARGGGAS
ncbi:hypothetical protein ACEZDB_26920 [Streptacidiphilus sp. N1-3]|uniref:Uncharacterized protein n=1 Tax=Streptacidiphilus alkalitolerans TaxID=3342712 RepID=A0ABV6X7K5_9ACTN